MLQAKGKLSGQVGEKSLGGDKNDLKTVDVLFMGGKFTFYAVDAIYDHFNTGDAIVVTFDLEPDPKAAGNNKLRPVRNSIKADKA